MDTSGAMDTRGLWTLAGLWTRARGYVHWLGCGHWRGYGRWWGYGHYSVSGIDKAARMVLDIWAIMQGMYDGPLCTGHTGGNCSFDLVKEVSMLQSLKLNDSQSLVVSTFSRLSQGRSKGLAEDFWQKF
jgi:hypothetical protein